MRKTGSGRKRKLQIPALILCVFVTAAFLSGCRECKKLEEIVYTDDADEVDYDQHELEPSDAGDPDVINTDVRDEQDDTVRDTEQIGRADDTASGDSGSVKVSLALTAENLEADETPGNSSEQKGDDPVDAEDPLGLYNSDSNASSALSGGEESENSESADGETLSSGGDGDGTDDEEQNGTSGTDNGVVPGDPEYEPDNNDDGRTYKTVTDAAGREVEIPTDADMVTAVGAAASIVEMIGGAGRLAGSNEDFLNSGWGNVLLSDLGDICQWWSGTGAGSIGEESFGALLGTDRLDVCFEISGQNTFTDEQVERIEKAGKACVVLYPLDSIQHLKDDVAIVGQVMNVRSGDEKDCGEVAALYSGWADEILSDVSSKTSSGALYTVYIGAWDSDAVYELSMSGFSMALPETPDLTGSYGSGLAVAWSGSSSTLIRELMSDANIKHTIHSSLKGKNGGIYITPMIQNMNPLISGSYYQYNVSVMPSYAYGMYTLIDGTTYGLGSGICPALIVADTGVRDAITSSWFWTRFPNTGNGYYYAPGQDGQSYNYYSTTAYSSYEIHVTPTGLQNWAEGSVESPLEAVWLAYRFYGAYNDGDIRSYVYNFYNTFFGAELTDSQIDELLGIGSFDTSVVVQ